MSDIAAYEEEPHYFQEYFNEYEAYKYNLRKNPLVTRLDFEEEEQEFVSTFMDNNHFKIEKDYDCIMK